jgi:hypothetical protein
VRQPDGGDDRRVVAHTETCEAPHFRYHVSGRLAIRISDGTELCREPGDITPLPSGHDPWVVGDGPVVVVHWYGASSYAKPAWRRMCSSGNGRPSSSSGDRPTTVNPSAS